MEDGSLGHLSLHPGSLGSTEEAGGLWVLDFVTSSVSRFYSFEHFIQTPKPSHCFYLLGRASVRSGLFLSIAFKVFSGLGMKREERKDTPPPLTLPISLVLLQGNSWAHSTGPQGGGSHTSVTPLSKHTLESASLLSVNLEEQRASGPPS